MVDEGGVATPVSTMVAPAVPAFVAARLVDPAAVDRAEDPSDEFETAVPEGKESSVLGTVVLELTGMEPSVLTGMEPSVLTGMEPSVLTGIEPSLLIVELSDTGIDSTGIIDEDSHESQPEMVWLEDTMISGLE